MVKRYCVLFHRPLVEPEDFAAGMVRMGIPLETAAHMTAKTPWVMKGGLTLEEARRYAEAVQEAGGRATIRADIRFDAPDIPASDAPIATFREFTMCPRCGYKQQRTEQCAKCGGALSPGGE